MIKIENIKIKGRETDCGDINLIIGANNTGKSTFIRELSASLSGAEVREDFIWIEKIGLHLEKAKEEFENLFPNVLDAISFQSVSDLNKYGLGNVFQVSNWNEVTFKEISSRGNEPRRHELIKNTSHGSDFEYFRFIVGLKTLIEDCSQRLTGPFNATINRITDPPSNVVHYLNINRNIFDRISEHIKSVFGFGIVFDDLMQGLREVRLEPSLEISDEIRANPETHIGFWEQNAKSIESQGDGIKAYLRLCYALFNPAKNIILIDEPEAFLHPPQRRSLGRFIYDNANQGKQLFVATHDSEILRGILNNALGKNIKLFHLKNNDGYFSFVCNEGKDLLGESRRLNEQNLNSFFHKTTVLCEAEDDRMVYQYSADKYFGDESRDINFIGYNGKPEVKKNLEFLRGLGLNACCIFDVDALYSQEILSDSIGLSDENKIFLTQLIDEIYAVLKIGDKSNSQKSDFKEKGIEILPEEIKNKSSTAIAILKSCGIFIIGKGCLESWIDVDESEKKKVQVMLNKIDTEVVSDLKAFLEDVIKYHII